MGSSGAGGPGPPEGSPRASCRLTRRALRGRGAGLGPDLPVAMETPHTLLSWGLRPGVALTKWTSQACALDITHTTYIEEGGTPMDRMYPWLDVTHWIFLAVLSKVVLKYKRFFKGLLWQTSECRHWGASSFRQGEQFGNTFSSFCGDFQESHWANILYTDSSPVSCCTWNSGICGSFSIFTRAAEIVQWLAFVVVPFLTFPFLLYSFYIDSLPA